MQRKENKRKKKRGQNGIKKRWDYKYPSLLSSMDDWRVEETGEGEYQILLHITRSKHPKNYKPI